MFLQKTYPARNFNVSKLNCYPCMPRITIAYYTERQCFGYVATDREHGDGEGMGGRLILIGVVFTDLCRDLQKTIASQPAAAPPSQPEYQKPKGAGKEEGRRGGRERGCGLSWLLLG